MSSLGLYFGPSAISIVETKGKKLIKNINIPHSAFLNPGPDQKISPEALISELVALIIDELRRNKISNKEANICLSGKDLIVRNFEIPNLPKEELQSAISFEVKKYIPFKIDDLIFDFQVKLKKPSGTNSVLFIGIKKDTLEKYISILKQIDIKIKNIEYSAFSLLRLIPLAGVNDKDVLGVLSLDFEEKDEVNVVVSEENFPLFSRDIVLAETLQEPADQGKEASTPVLEKLKKEIRLSLDYYNRKFSEKAIKKILFVSDRAYKNQFEAIMAELGIPAQYVDISSIDKSAVYSSTFIKAFCVSLYSAVKSKLAPNLLTARQKSLQAKVRVTAKKDFTLYKLLLPSPMTIIWSVILCAAAFGLGFYTKEPARKEFQNILSARPQVTTVNPEASLQELAEINSVLKKKIAVLDNLITKQVYSTELLDAIPRVLPEGVWLTNFSFANNGYENVSLSLEGMAYLGDEKEEYNAVGQFLSNLKLDSKINKFFKEIKIDSLERSQFEEEDVTRFFISCVTR